MRCVRDYLHDDYMLCRVTITCRELLVRGGGYRQLTYGFHVSFQQIDELERQREAEREAAIGYAILDQEQADDALYESLSEMHVEAGDMYQWE